MCEFCIKHGEGKKWYLNVKNYSYDLLSDIKRKKFVKNHFYWIDKTYNKYFNFLKGLPLDVPIINSFVKAIIKRIFIYKHWGQIIPIEDVEDILNIANSITRVPCVCRAVTTGKKPRLCFLISVNPGKLGIDSVIDPSYFGGPDVAKFERVERKWTLDFIKENQRKGMINTIWSLKAPFIGVLCNCDYSSGCIPMKMLKEVAPVTFKAEYVAEIDAISCIGCGECMKICPFDAIVSNKKTKKPEVDVKKCHGCGICRTVCKKNAIILKNRQDIPSVAHLW